MYNKKANSFFRVIVLYLFRSHQVAWINGRREHGDLLIGELSFRSGGLQVCDASK